MKQTAAPGGAVGPLLAPGRVLVDVAAADQAALVAALCAPMRQQGLVDDGFAAAVLRREAEYPTGLPTAPYPVAIPHTLEKSTIRRSGILVARLAAPISFGEMGSEGNMLAVRLVFLLAVADGDTQLEVLRQLMRAFSQPGALEALAQTPTAAALYEALAALFA